MWKNRVLAQPTGAGWCRVFVVFKLDLVKKAHAQKGSRQNVLLAAARKLKLCSLDLCLAGVSPSLCPDPSAEPSICPVSSGLTPPPPSLPYWRELSSLSTEDTPRE